MAISLTNIETALQQEDVENLLALGAPADEYLDEAKEIESALLSLTTSQLTEANIAAIISLVWVKHFGLSSEDIKKRIPAFQQIAQRLL